MQRAILLLADGLRPDVAEDLLAAGQLPNLAAMLSPRGVSRALTCLPSTTNVAYLPFLTGCTPGRLNVPAIRWLDRTQYAGRWWRDRHALRSYCGYQAGLLDHDLPADVRTIWELVPESAGFFTPIARGLTPERDPASGARKFWGALAHFVVPLHRAADRAVARGLLRAVEQPWRFIFAQFPAVDGFTHSHGPGSPQVHRAMRDLDATVGRLRAALVRQGALEDTLIVLVSDHGAAPVHTHLDLAEWFRRHGVPTLSHPILWARAPRCAVTTSGNGHAMVYAQPGTPRADRWPVARLRRPDAFGAGRDLVQALAREPAVAFVAGESGRGGLELVSSDGSAEIFRTGSRVIYRPRTGDPLRIGATRVATPDEWLAYGALDPYPDAAVQLLDQFQASRTGDLVVVAAEGFDLRERFEAPEHRAGHGSAVRSHMQIPLWSSEPLPASPLRSVDVFPALLDWLGEPIPAGIDARQVWLPGTRRRQPTHRPVRPAAAMAG
jgi:arylsulfatase A-like enzyme